VARANESGEAMELYIFGRFQVRVGEEPAFEEALREAVTATRGEAGCLEIYGCRGVRGCTTCIRGGGMWRRLRSM